MTKQKDTEDLLCLSQVSEDASLILIWDNKDPISQSSTILAPKRTIKEIIRETEGTVLQMESGLNHLVKYLPQELPEQAGLVEFLEAQIKSLLLSVLIETMIPNNITKEDMARSRMKVKMTQ
jgi:hypothetical protein